MFSVPQYTSTELQQYDYFVMQDPVFEPESEAPAYTHVYEENGLLYCASQTSQGVYYYTYALNNPLKFIDPSGYYNKPSPLERERAKEDRSYYNPYFNIANPQLAGNYHTSYTPDGAGTHTYIETSDASAWVKNTDIHTIYGTDPAFVNFFDNLAAEWGDESFSLSLGFAYNNMWIVGNSKITGMKSSFGALNDANFMNFQAATVFGFFSNNGAPWDLNGDGRLSFKESINWWRNGHGEPIRVPLSSVNLSRITPSHFNGIGSTRTLRLLLIGTVNDGLVHGRISLRLYPNNNVKAFDGYYDFDYKPWLTHPIRNVLTLFDQAIHGQGQRYEIDFTGSAPISSNPSISDYYMRGGLLW